jgi:hypothetical protein
MQFVAFPLHTAQTLLHLKNFVAAREQKYNRKERSKSRCSSVCADSDEIDHCFRVHVDHSFRGHADQDRSEATLAFVILEK